MLCVIFFKIFHTKNSLCAAYEFIYLSHWDETIIEVPYFLEQLLPWLESESFAIGKIAYLSEPGKSIR
jgi:hypothetical protein